MSSRARSASSRSMFVFGDVDQSNGLRVVVLHLEHLRRRVVGDLVGGRDLADALAVLVDPDVDERELRIRRDAPARELADAEMTVAGDDDLPAVGGGDFAREQEVAR